ncbi:MAG: class I SAM-dependent methyltransferase [Haloarculaceae archaeon]
MSVAAFYGRYARLYDALATLPGVDRWRDRAAAALDLAPGDTVVEMGCGTGANLPHLRERVGSAGRVVGVDLARPLLARARRRTARWSNVHLLAGDATRPPVARADAVLGTFVVGMLADPAAAVERWCDLVGPGGRVAVLEATRSCRLPGWPLNLAFDWFVRAGAPGGGAGASAALDERVRTAHAALAARTVARRHAQFAAGFVDLVSGTVAAE